MINSEKKYGLVNLKAEKAKQKQNALAKKFQPKANIFGDEDSEGDDEAKPGPGPVKGAIRVEVNSRLKQKTQLEIEKAMKEDPTVYQYDEVYDDIHSKKEAEAEKNKKDKQRKAKYIGNLLRTSELRKLEEERRNQRKLKKESERNKEEFAGKEEFVTSAYRQRVEQLKQDEERQRQQDLLDEKNDVTKQDNLSMFYRQLLKSQSNDIHSEVKINAVETNLASHKDEDTLKKDNKRQEIEKDFSSTSSSYSESDDEALNRNRHKEYISREKLFQEAAINRKKRKEEEQRQKQKEMAEKYKRKADNDTISDAKLRYLMRKQQKSKPIIEDSD